MVDGLVMLLRGILVFVSVVAALCWGVQADAQSCGCDHTIDAATTYVDASKLAKPVKPTSSRTTPSSVLAATGSAWASRSLRTTRSTTTSS